ncbi:putative oxidoreductase, NADP(H)-dependent aldo-keto reductase [Candidatus Terasakiella magnetica]|uniref:Protein tas n=1 Tax=Candidatus Terasakiella magnetica TaxID=1867952 RepID=A0A1C3RFV5_9PROT|nr:NADP(H)-dependent aldo-keto reductase [Candidatus Terasakiella magnetica]SCA56160.1 putative oxidoreductase, NADP(H)-dependent aldo-keto reductase [Candidatus Terasakiella magnetica]
MHYKKLGRTDIDVSLVCLGTMTWGEQNSEAEGHEQMDYATAQGVNFFDVAEMYPVTPRKETYADTERVIGTWFEKRGKRDDIVLASKVIGPGNFFDYIRDGAARLTEKDIMAAVEDSLARLKTDYIDIYQIHWPSRPTNYFGQLNYPDGADYSSAVPIEETLGAMVKLVEQGKIRHIGVSNESAWGVMEYLRLSEKNNWPRIVSIQNPYNLMTRQYEVGLSEVSVREDVGLLAYSPLGGGTLSGKYIGGQQPEGARMTLWPERYSRFTKPRAKEATQAYYEIAKKHGLDMSQMALAYLKTKSFMTASIIGATNLEQLKSNILAYELDLSEEVLADIEAAHVDNPNPAP